MIVFKDGKIYVDELETTDPELIGYGILDFMDANEGKQIEIVAIDPSRIMPVPGFYGVQCNDCDGKFIQQQ